MSGDVGLKGEPPDQLRVGVDTQAVAAVAVRVT